MPWLPGFDWYDLQRLSLMVVSFFSILSFVFLKPPLVSRFLVLLFCVFFISGFLSVCFSEFFFWSMWEWLTWVGLFFFAVLTFLVVREVFFLNIFCVLFVFLSFFVCFMFFIYFFIGYFFFDRFSPVLAVYGFDNPRFLAQFQVLCVGFLCWLLIDGRFGRYLLVFSSVSLFCNWMVLLLLGSRGAVFSLIFVAVLFFFLRPSRRIFFYLFFYPFLVFLVYLAALFFFAGEMQGSSDLFRGGLSLREVLWRGALRMFWSSPLVGVGPLHFAAEWNHIAAHPHQLLLQLLAEWGGAAALAFLCWVICVARMVIYEQRFGRNPYVFLGIGAAFILAQVDGVLVTPVSQGAVAIFSGFAFGHSGSPVKAGPSWDGGRWVRFLCFVLSLNFLFYIWVGYFDHAVLVDSFFINYGLGSPPRMWGQGWIPML